MIEYQNTHHQLEPNSVSIDRLDAPVDHAPVLSQALWDTLSAEVRQRAKHGNEFVAFLLGKDGVATNTVTVGFGHRTGVVIDPQEVVNALAPYLYSNQGWQVIAHAHNHPPENLSDYELAGYPKEYGLSPSIQDLDNPISRMVQLMNSDTPFAHIILAFDSATEKVISSSYVLTGPTITDHQANLVTFNEPVTIIEHPDEEIQIVGAKYTNPEALFEIGALQFTPTGIAISDTARAARFIDNPVEVAMQIRQIASQVVIEETTGEGNPEQFHQIRTNSRELLIEQARNNRIVRDKAVFTPSGHPDSITAFHQSSEDTFDQRIFDHIYGVSIQISIQKRLTSKQIYRFLSRLYHPDLYQTEDGEVQELASEYFRTINRMYEANFFEQ